MYSLLEHFPNSVKQFCVKLHDLRFLYTKQNKKNVELSPSNILNDSDYEFLFNQLLDGVTHGWHEGRILKYFEDLEEKGKAKLWVLWLNNFREKVLLSENSDLHLASKMIRLGELAQSFPPIESIGKISYDIGQELYVKKTKSEAWGNIDVETLNLTNNILTQPIFSSISFEEESLIVDGLEHLLQDKDLVIDLPNESISNLEDSQSLTANTSALSKNYFKRGMEKFSLRDWERAILLLDKALVINPSFSIAWYNRGKALRCLGDNDQAVSNFNNALILDPQNTDFLDAKAQLLYDLQNWSESIEIWDQILNIQPSNYKVWYSRGRCLESMKQFSKAIDSYKRALEIVPNLKPVLKRLRKLYDIKHRLK